MLDVGRCCVTGDYRCRFEWVARCRITTAPRKAACLVRLPLTRFRHIRNDEGFIWRRINEITADSLSPNWASMASNAVRSSQAISTIREMLAAHNVLLEMFWLLKSNSVMKVH
jgi:hypothetical protein